MGVSVLVLGHSGSGKSTSLRNFEEGEIGIFNVAGKPLPFRKKLSSVGKTQSTYQTIRQTLACNKSKAYVIDDANYLMAFQNFNKAKEIGYGKFTDMALEFEKLLEMANSTDEDTIVYFMMHPEYDEGGRLKPKTIGKMLDSQLCVEGMFPIVLRAFKDDSGYHFATQSDGNDPVKTPMGMFDEQIIDNDLKFVDNAIREYWGMKPIKDRKNEDGK